jgi:hypothetical protein
MSSAGLFPEVGVPQPDRGTDALPGTDIRKVFTQPPSGPSPSDELSRINFNGVEAFGASLDNLADRVLVPYLNQQAAEEGSTAVAKDPQTGQLTVMGGMRSNILPWGRAFNDAAQKSYVLLSDSANKTAIQQIYLDNADDPQVAKVLADKYIMGAAQKSLPETRGAILASGQQASEEYLRGAVLDKHDRDIKKFVGASKAALCNRTLVWCRAGTIWLKIRYPASHRKWRIVKSP